MKTVFVFESKKLKESKDVVTDCGTDGKWNGASFIVEDEEEATDLAHHLTMEGIEFQAV